MRSYKDFIKRVGQYKAAEWVYTDCGYIAWQLSTGENVELLFIEVLEPGKGYATELVREMCKRIKPFNSVFVVRLASNKRAGYFYRKMGFREHPIWGLYSCKAVLGTVSYKKLCHYLSQHPSSGKRELKTPTSMETFTTRSIFQGWNFGKRLKVLTWRCSKLIRTLGF